LGIGDWGLGIGDWGLGNPQSPIPNPQYITIKVTQITTIYFLIKLIIET